MGCGCSQATTTPEVIQRKTGVLAHESGIHAVKPTAGYEPDNARYWTATSTNLTKQSPSNNEAACQVKSIFENDVASLGSVPEIADRSNSKAGSSVESKRGKPGSSSEKQSVSSSGKGSGVSVALNSKLNVVGRANTQPLHGKLREARAAFGNAERFFEGNKSYDIEPYTRSQKKRILQQGLQWNTETKDETQLNKTYLYIPPYVRTKRAPLTHQEEEKRKQNDFACSSEEQKKKDNPYYIPPYTRKKMNLEPLLLTQKQQTRLSATLSHSTNTRATSLQNDNQGVEQSEENTSFLPTEESEHSSVPRRLFQKSQKSPELVQTAALDTNRSKQTNHKTPQTERLQPTQLTQTDQILPIQKTQTALSSHRPPVRKLLKSMTSKGSSKSRGKKINADKATDLLPPLPNALVVTAEPTGLDDFFLAENTPQSPGDDLGDFPLNRNHSSSFTLLSRANTESFSMA